MRMLYTLVIAAVIVPSVMLNAREIKRIGGDRPALRLHRPAVAKPAQVAPVVDKAAEPRKARVVSPKRKTGDKARVTKLTNQYIAALDRLIEPDAVTVEIKVDRVMGADGKCVIHSDVIIGDGEAVKTY